MKKDTGADVKKDPSVIDASPSKALFIDMLTKDIPLITSLTS